MNTWIEPDDVIAVVQSFMAVNEGDEATCDILIAVGAELLDVSNDRMLELLHP